MKRLGVLGTAVLDTIRGPDEAAPVRALGGILYSLAAFEARPARGWSVVPILKVGRDARAEVDAFLSRLSRVAAREGVRTVDEPNNRVELVYAEDGSRTERLSGGVPGWAWEELRPLAAACDALYVNLIAGWELELPTAEKMGAAVDGPLYCDLHSLLLAVEDDGTRRPEAPADWREWTGCFDYLQVNREELELLASDAGTESWELARELPGRRPRILFVTLGPDGALWFDGSRGERGPAAGRSPRPTPGEDGDATGCGDVWGVTCFGALLEGLESGRAVRRANALARRNAALSGAAALLDASGATG